MHLHDTRRLLCRRFPYGVIYRITEPAIQVIAVAHGDAVLVIGSRDGFKQISPFQEFVRLTEYRFQNSKIFYSRLVTELALSPSDSLAQTPSKGPTSIESPYPPAPAHSAWNCQTDLLRCFQIDDELELLRLLHPFMQARHPRMPFNNVAAGLPGVRRFSEKSPRDYRIQTVEQ